MTKKLHWTQTPEGKAKMSAAQKKVWAEKRSPLQEIAKKIVRKSKKRGPYKVTKKEKKETSLVINGWRITLGKNEVRIDND